MTTQPASDPAATVAPGRVAGAGGVTDSLFESVLVANRGEIACRIIRSLRALGIRSIAVYSDADRDALHVSLADAAVRIGPAEARQSYLNAEAIIGAACSAGAQAIHPGYGFLSENAEFARACASAGLVFVGPGERALEVMGDKIRAKTQVAAHGVPTTPGIAEPGLSDAALAEAAERIGYPVLIKPSAGGGGKGMYAVERAGDLPESLAAARRIAAAAFGDDTLFLERLVTQPRHIEVQVLADRFGNTIHLGERECSLQRRHQKVIEEAPSALLSEETRARIGEAACAVARSVGYLGAGTVEFLVSDRAPEEFFFMEMNTRLQVEHPVTELVTGIDLVEWQLRIAAGQPLAFAQEDVVLRGHAIEARLYAEDPRHEFLPQAGRVLRARMPAGDGIRVDGALADGVAIPPDYDPMLAKVIAWGPDRAMALARLEGALAGTIVLGVHTNAEYLAALLADPSVRAGALDTGLIERTLPGIRFRDPDSVTVAAAAAVLFAEAWDGAGRELWRQPSGWRLGAVRPVRYSFATADGASAEADILGTPSDARVRVLWDHRPAAGTGDGADPGAGAEAEHGSEGAAEDGVGAEGWMRVRLRERAEHPAGPRTGPDTLGAPPIGGDAARESRTGFGTLGEPRTGSGTSGARQLEVDGVTRAWWSAREGDRLWLSADGVTCELIVRDRARVAAERLAERSGHAPAVDPEVRSPMPGTVASVPVSSGDEVEAGATIVTVEAMKMEHRLLAPAAGRVEVSVRAGEQVRAGQAVARITVPSDPSPGADASSEADADPEAAASPDPVPDSGGSDAGGKGSEERFG